MAKKKIYVVFGSTPNRMACDGDWKELAEYWKEDSQALGTREFETDAEINAYIKGINDSLGWEDVMCLDSKEVKKLAKHIKLSEVYPCCEF